MMSRVSEALSFAMEAHAGQKRKVSGAPYVVHLLDVAKFLLYADAPEDLVVAGILHDVLEDTAVPEEEVEERFGSRVLRLVRFCTEPGNTPDASDEDLLRTWRGRKEHAVAAAKQASDDELMLKFADALANLTSFAEDRIILGDAVWSSFRGGKDGSEWYFRSLGVIFKERFSRSALYALYERELQELFPRA